jgi:hypothetical protein
MANVAFDPNDAAERFAASLGAPLMYYVDRRGGFFLWRPGWDKTPWGEPRDRTDWWDADDYVDHRLQLWMKAEGISGTRRNHADILGALKNLRWFMFTDAFAHSANELPTPERLEAWLKRGVGGLEAKADG